MGSRATDKLKEIDALRSGLSDKLGELEQRFPMAAFGRKAAAMLAGGSAGGTALAFAFRRLRGRRRGKKSPAGAGAPAPVVVNVFPRSTTFVAVTGIAVWAGVRLYEAMGRTRNRGAEDSFRPAVVKPMPESGRQTGS